MPAAVQLELRGVEQVRKWVRDFGEARNAMAGQNFSDKSKWGDDLMRLSAEAISESVTREFAEQTFYYGDPKAKKSSKRKWKPDKGFHGPIGSGYSEPPGPALNSTGRLRRAWTLLSGTGDSLRSIGKSRIRWGVKPGAIPYAKLFRGEFGSAGSGGVGVANSFVVKPRHFVRSNKRTGKGYNVRRPMAKMWWWYLYNRKAILGHDKLVREGIRIDTRPHGYVHPDLARRFDDIFLFGLREAFGEPAKGSAAARRLR